MRVRYDRLAVIQDVWTMLAASAICFRLLHEEISLAAEVLLAPESDGEMPPDHFVEPEAGGVRAGRRFRVSLGQQCDRVKSGARWRTDPVGSLLRRGRAYDPATPIWLPA